MLNREYDNLEAQGWIQCLVVSREEIMVRGRRGDMTVRHEGLIDRFEVKTLGRLRFIRRRVVSRVLNRLDERNRRRR